MPVPIVRRPAAPRALPAPAALLAAALLAACGGADDGGDGAVTADSAAAPAATAPDPSAADAPTLVGTITGFETPEAVVHDPEQDVYFVSSIGGNPSQKDGNGAIARVHADSLDAPNHDFIRGGRPGITLHAPKGMAIVGDTLWVADIDAVRAFNRRTGRQYGAVSLAPLGATFLNDVARGPGDTVYVSDTGIRFDANGTMSRPGPNRIYAIVGRTPTVAVEGEILAGPNGIVWDSAGRRLLVAPFNGPTLLAWSPGGSAPNPRRLAAGPGSFDGLVRLDDGRLLVTSWADSSVYAVRADTAMSRLITGVEAPAALGLDAGRNRVLVPLFNENRVVVYELR